MRSNCYQEYVDGWPDEEMKLKEFDEKWGIPVIRRLRNLKNRNAFLAALTEIRFGCFFAEFCTELFYEKATLPPSPKTPDWTLSMNSQRIIAEVFRLNESAEDTLIMNIGDRLRDELSKIPLNFTLSLTYIKRDIDWDSFDWTDFRQKVQNWLSTKPKKGGILPVGKMRVRILNDNATQNYVVVVGPSHRAYQKVQRLTGQNGRFIDKVIKYSQVVEDNQIPFIICIYLKFESWFDPNDVAQFLYGTSVEFWSDRQFNGYYPGCQFWDIGKGLFYNHLETRNNVSGVLLRYQDKYHYFHNYSSRNRLNDQNISVLQKFAYQWS